MQFRNFEEKTHYRVCISAPDMYQPNDDNIRTCMAVANAIHASAVSISSQHKTRMCVVSRYTFFIVLKLSFFNLFAINIMTTVMWFRDKLSHISLSHAS